MSKKTGILIFTFLSLFFAFLTTSKIFADQKIEIYFFWGQGCPHCAGEKVFLEELKEKYPQIDIQDFEIYYNKKNQELFKKITQAYKTTASGVPMIFIGKEFVVGFDSPESIGKEIESLIQKCLKSPCPSPKEILEKGLDSVSEPTPAKKTICIHYFVNDQCSQCESLKSYLKEVSQKYNIKLEVYNVSEDKLNEEFYYKLHQHYGLYFSGFPMVFVGDSYFLGETAIRNNLETVIKRCQKQGCPCTVEEIKKSLTQLPHPETFTPQEKEKFSIEIFGKKIEFSTGSPLYFLGMVLGLADGINPCMFSVLLFLITYLLAIGSKKRALRAGLAFTLGVFVIYFLFMAGMINLISLIGVIQKIKIIVAILALFAGLVMIKDFFAYGKWFSLEIPNRAKPIVEKLIKKGTVPSALVLALLSSFVELPCTAGIPLVYVTLLAQKGGSYFLYLLWYNIFFVLPLFVIIGLIFFAQSRVEKIENWRENFRKYMRLVAGLVLLFLGLALLLGWM